MTPPYLINREKFVDKDLFRHMFETQIKKEFGDNASFATREYVHDRKYRKHRVSGRIIGGGPEGVSQLYEIVHTLITDEERGRIFPGAFDLGNFQDIPAERCKYVELESEIYNETKIDPEEVLKTIKKRIADLLDKKFSNFFSKTPSKSLKVLKTLYRFQRDYRFLFTLLAPPHKTGKPSFEIRDSYGIDGSNEEVEIISDLKTHLSFEIPRERLRAIISAYGQMRGVLDAIEEMLIQQATSQCGNNLKKFELIVQYMSDCIESILKIEDREPVELPLDELLFTYLIQLEFSHHVAASSHLFDAVIANQPPFVESWSTIGQLMSNLGFQGISAQHFIRSTDDLIKDFTSGASSLINFYSTIFDREIDSATYSKALPLFEKLLKVHSYSEAYKNIRFTIAIGAMALVLTELHESTPYKPYWYGQGNITGGLVEFLKSVRFEHINLDSPEGSTRYWTGRLDYFTYAMVGQETIYKARLIFNKTINESIIRILETLDLDLLDEKLSLFVSTNGGTAL